jgi:hypothetical protein
VNIRLILRDNGGNGITLIVNNIIERHLLPSLITNMPILGKVSDRLMSTLALKNYTTGVEVPVYTNSSKIDDRKTSASTVVFDQKMVSWENKTHLSCKCAVYDIEIFVIIDRL